MALDVNQITVNLNQAVSSANVMAADATLTTNIPSGTLSISSGTRPSKPERLQVPKARSSSSVLDEFFRHPDRKALWRSTREQVRHGEYHGLDGIGNIGGMDGPGVGDLVDFLRNQTPPPDNYMSIPDDVDTRDRGSWRSKFGSLKRRSKSAPKTPQLQIQLPDSAVAGTTIGGHRHIAISIPIEYSPFGPTPRCQYPVYQQQVSKSGMPQPQPQPQRSVDSNSVLRFTDNRGVVTILRTVSEGRESPPSRDPSQQSPLSPSIHSFGATISPPQSPQTSVHGQFKDYLGIPSAGLSPPVHHRLPPRDDTNSKGQKRDESPVIPPFGGQNTAKLTPRLHHPLPKRLTAFPGTTAGPTESIDGVMHGQGDRRDFSVGPQAVAPSSSFSVRPRPVSDSIATYGTSAAPVELPAPTVSVLTVSGHEGGEAKLATQERGREGSSGDEPEVHIITSNPLESPSSSSSSEKAAVNGRKSRKERVREKKRRDVEASRASRERHKHEAGGSSRGTSSGASSEFTCLRCVEQGPARISTPSRQSPRVQSMTPMVVVADVEPSTPPEPPNRRQGRRSLATFRSPVSTPPGTTAMYTTSSGPTPPQSPQSPESPRPASGPGSRYSHPPLDQTSLSRRREWKTERQRERQGRKERAKSMTFIADPVSAARTSRREVLKGYESLRELRIREMERRMRRLERNGDIWLRAIVPVLDNLNKTLVMMQDDRRGEPDTDTDTEQEPEKVDETPEKRGRSSGSVKRPRRRAATLRETVLDLGQLERDLVGDGESSVSGLDTIEPLMRELQGASRLSLEVTRERMGNDGEEDDDDGSMFEAF